MHMVHLTRVQLILSLALAFALQPASAHDPGLSGLAVKIHEDRVEAAATFARADINAIFDTEPTKEQLLQLAPEILSVTSAGRSLLPGAVAIDPSAPNNDIEFRFTYPVSDPGHTWGMRSLLIARLAPGHRQYLSVLDSSGRLETEKLLRADANAFDVRIDTGTPTGEASIPTTFFEFVRMGIMHILTGYDHLLFLAALLIVSRNFVSSLKIISCFTLGHSITLALATLNIVNLSSRIVEPLIAASIIYVSVENLLKHGAPTGRYVLTFAFGLIHGLGFASALREMGVGLNGGGVVLPLLGFNLGVELGQLSVAAIVLPIFWSLRSNPIWVRRWVPVCSGIVALAGTYWFVERVAGFGN